jgi:hypothetical protein
MFKKLLIFIIFLVLFVPKLSVAQGAAIKELDDKFAWEVKQIDEFIERFDAADSTLIQEYNIKNKMAPLTRTNLIKSLFNYERKDWNFTELTAFLHQVDNRAAPVMLSFTDDKWFANVSCSVTQDGKPKTVMLKLKIQKMPAQSFKWVIFDASAAFLSEGGKVTQPVLPPPVDKNAFLNPMSHSLNFFNLDMMSLDTRNISNYIALSGDYTNDLGAFVSQCMSHRIKVIGVKSVTYTFLQIKGWDMEIQQFNRASRNSGWLISKLIKLPS